MGGLSSDTTEEDLRKYFDEFGTVRREGVLDKARGIEGVKEKKRHCKR